MAKNFSLHFNKNENDLDDPNNLIEVKININ